MNSIDAPHADGGNEVYRSVLVEVMNACTGDHMFGPILLQYTEKVSFLIRRLQYHAFTHCAAESCKRFKLIFNGRHLDPSQSLQVVRVVNDMLEATDNDRDISQMDTAQMMVLDAIAEPILFTWDQLIAMPGREVGPDGENVRWTPSQRDSPLRIAMHAWGMQKQMRRLCIALKIEEIDVNGTNYDWRLLMKKMITPSTKQIIGPGITAITFRLLSAIDPNYAPGGPEYMQSSFTAIADPGRRHAFEITSANGDTWLMHFHATGARDLEHFPFNGNHRWQTWTECCEDAD